MKINQRNILISISFLFMLAVLGISGYFLYPRFFPSKYEDQNLVLTVKSTKLNSFSEQTSKRFTKFVSCLPKRLIEDALELYGNSNRSKFIKLLNKKEKLFEVLNIFDDYSRKVLKISVEEMNYMDYFKLLVLNLIFNMDHDNKFEKTEEQFDKFYILNKTSYCFKIFDKKEIFQGCTYCKCPCIFHFAVSETEIYRKIKSLFIRIQKDICIVKF